MNKYETKTLKRISKHAARRVYDNGGVITIIACKLSPENTFYNFGITTNKTRCGGATFDQFVNAYEFYNCNYECGYYAAFYIRRDA